MAGLKNKLADEWKHDVVFESIEAHEVTHAKKFGEEATSGSAAIWGLMEVSAYLDGIRVLMSWLERNCPEIDSAEAGERIRRIEETSRE